MSLKTILAAKGREVVSIDFTADLSAAAKLLTKHRIGALVVLGAGGASRRNSVGARHRTRYCGKWNYRSAVAGRADDDA